MLQKNKPSVPAIGYGPNISSTGLTGMPPEASMKELNKTVIRLDSEGRVKRGALTATEWVNFVRAFTFNTNAIEGSHISREGVDTILLENVGREEKGNEVMETYGVAAALAFLVVTNDHVNTDLMKHLHGIVFQGRQDAGSFRGPGQEVVVRAGRTILHVGTPQPQLVSSLDELCGWYDKNREEYHPLVLGGIVHNQFLTIHPFRDGNGRVSRLLLANILLRHGLLPLNIELTNRDEYYNALIDYQKGGWKMDSTIALFVKEYNRLGSMLRNPWST